MVDLVVSNPLLVFLVSRVNDELLRSGNMLPDLPRCGSTLIQDTWQLEHFPLFELTAILKE